MTNRKFVRYRDQISTSLVNNEVRWVEDLLKYYGEDLAPSRASLLIVLIRDKHKDLFPDLHEQYEEEEKQFLANL